MATLPSTSYYGYPVVVLDVQGWYTLAGAEAAATASPTVISCKGILIFLISSPEYLVLYENHLLKKYGFCSVSE